jgi:hypothetical protein
MILAAFHPGMLVFPVLISFIVAIIWAIRVHARKSREQIQAFAQRAGLRVNEQTVLGFTSVQSLEGEQTGRGLRYWSFATGTGKARTHWVAVGVRPQATAGLTFGLTRQNLGTKLMELFGTQEIQVGDPAFDAAWFVRTNQPDFFAAALVPQIRARLLAEPAGRRSARYEIKDGVVQYVEQGYLSGNGVLAHLERQLPLLHELADVAEVFAASGR